MVVMNQKDELEKAFYQMPIHSDLLNYWKKHEETDPIKKALRFLFLSNFMPTGHQVTIDLNPETPKKTFKHRLDKTFEFISDVKFANIDCNKFINSTIKRVFSSGSKIEETYIYCDPPYLNTDDNYSNSFTEVDSIDLFNTLQETGCKWAMSEFDNEFILNQAKERGLNVHIIGERQNLKNRRTEILITNYAQYKTLFD